MTKRESDLIEIKRIISERDADAVEESGYILIDTYPRDNEILTLLCKIFESDWHTRHEDLALSFQYIKNPITAKSLYNVAFSSFEYCNWDDNYPLQRKCTWALADIGTDQAKTYLKEIAEKANKTISRFAKKRLDNWENEQLRKGQMIRGKSKREFHLPLEKYINSQNVLPSNGQQIIGNELIRKSFNVKNYQTGELEEKTHRYIVVYQAYKPSIAEYAVENQKFGGKDFSFSRMSWIKPNFLWMMYRSGWAGKENQERILAIWIKKDDFLRILQESVFSSFNKEIYSTEENWRKELGLKNVRLQWDPDHDYKGNKLDRRAVQLGLKGVDLENFSNNQIACIEDITDFVKEQKILIDSGNIENLLIPKERVISIMDSQIEKQIGIKPHNKV